MHDSDQHAELVVGSRKVCQKLHAVVDAGSSGTRLFLYQVAAGNYPEVELVAEIENSVMPNGEKEDGLNNFVDPVRPELATQAFNLTIGPLLKRVKNILAEHAVMPMDVTVDLFATAGMRYSEQMYGSEPVEALYRAIANGIDAAGFQSGEVRTCDGEQEEGIWTWINLNDQERDIFRTGNEPLGIVEVGGSSAQFSFPASDALAGVGSCRKVSINGRQFDVQCKTYLGLGQDDARKMMRVNLGEKATACFPEKFSHEHDVGDVLDGIGHYKLTASGCYRFEACDTAYEEIIQGIDAANPIPDLSKALVDFVGTDAIYHATNYWDIAQDPALIAQMILTYCREVDAFPGIETNEFIQAQAANATYVRALLFGTRGLFRQEPARLTRAVPNKVAGKTRLSWTRGYLLQKYAST